MREFRPPIVKKFGPALHMRFDKIVAQALPPHWLELLRQLNDKDLRATEQSAKNKATRESSWRTGPGVRSRPVAAPGRG